MAYTANTTWKWWRRLIAAVEYLIASGIGSSSEGLPSSGFEATGDNDNAYNAIVTAPAWECRNLHVAVGNGGVRVSLNGGTDVHFYVPANTERQFPGLKIPASSVISAKKYVDAGTVSTNLAISVW